MIFVVTAAWGQESAAPPETRAVAEPREAPPAPLSYLGLLQYKAVSTNLTSTNPFLDGQVVGDLGGTSGLTADALEDPSQYLEQRLSTFLTYAPPILDGRASLTAAFEIDFGWGDRSYGIGGNTGGAFGADMVNLQTRRAYGTVKALRGTHDLTVHLGLQFVPDGPFDPASSRPDDLFRTSGRLMLFGSEAAGIAAYGRVGGLGGTRLRYRLGSFTLWEAAVADPDDVSLHVADVRWEPTWNVGAGLHAFWLRDRSGGIAGALGVGPTSQLAEIQGAAKLDLREGGTGVAPPVDADVWWLVADGGINHRLDRGPVGLNGMVAANLGRIYVEQLEDRNVRGLMLDGEARVRWLRGEGSVARAELMYTSADDPSDPTYTGVFTANTWGLVGALTPTHGTVLLMPDPLSFNRYTGVVHDPSFGGDGVLAATGSFGFDPIPNRVTTTVGGGWASSGGETVGTEVNAHLVAEALLFLNVGLHGGKVFGTSLPADPWIVYASFDWVVFP